jgi:hypothetical protein
VPGETHDAYVGDGTTITVDADARCRALTVEDGATLILPPGVRLTAERFVINLGTLQQTQPVNDGDVAFLEIQNEAGTSTLFRGAEVSSSDDLGEVTVSIQGLTASQYCVEPDRDAPPFVQRCYDITTGASGVAMVRLWALTYELNGIAEEDLSVYHPSGIDEEGPSVDHPNGRSTLMQLTANRAAGNDGGSYAFAEGKTDEFSVLLLGLRDSLPTAVVLHRLWARSGRNASLGLLLSPPLLLGLGALWAIRRRQNSARTPTSFAPTPLAEAARPRSEPSTTHPSHDHQPSQPSE